MNNYQQLFIDLKIKLTNEIYKKYIKQINEIARTQKKSVFTILDEIAKIILLANLVITKQSLHLAFIKM